MADNQPSRPDSDPGGYHGDWSRGAPLGRPASGTGEPTTAERFTLRKVRLNGDYDEGGAYWGSNSPGCILYYYEAGNISDYIRAADRADAKAIVTKAHPGAKFLR